MHKLLAVLLSILSLLPFATVAIQPDAVQQYLPCATWGVGKEHAYIAALKAYLQEYEPEGIKYLAYSVNPKLVEKDTLERTVQRYCDCHGIEILPSTDYRWLEENGYIIFTGMDSYIFPNGARLGFTDSEESPLNVLQGQMPGNAFIVEIGQWGGFAYIVKRVGFLWFVVRKDQTWVQ